jgi:prophage regulatory protein
MELELLDSADLEQIYGIRASTWRYWASIGQGPASMKLGKHRKWRRSTVEAWLAAQEAAAAK